MGLFDEIRKQIEEAMAEAQGQAAPKPRPRPQAQPGQRPPQQRRVGPPQPSAVPPLEVLEQGDGHKQAAERIQAKQQAAKEAKRKAKLAAAAKAKAQAAALQARKAAQQRSLRHDVHAMLSDPQSLRSAIVINEILGPPVSQKSGKRGFGIR